MGLAILHEVVFYLFEDSLFGRLVFHWQNFPQLLEQLLLRAVQLDRNLHIDMDEQIAPAMAIDVGYTFAADAKLRAGLRSLRNLDGFHAVESGNFELRAQGRLRYIDGNLAVQIVPMPVEDRMIADLENHVQVARRSPVRAGLSFLRQPQARAIIHARRHLDLQLTIHLPVSFALAHRTALLDYLARAIALSARAADG